MPSSGELDRVTNKVHEDWQVVNSQICTFVPEWNHTLTNASIVGVDPYRCVRFKPSYLANSLQLTIRYVRLYVEGKVKLLGSHWQQQLHAVLIPDVRTLI